MGWDDEPLVFGYVLAHSAEGGWWHIHFGRSRLIYRCELLGRPTGILAGVQWFGPGVVAKSSQFLLTLDGDGVELSADQLSLEFGWDGEGAKSEAFHFQREVMPLLYDSAEFQMSLTELVRARRYRRPLLAEAILSWR